MTIGDAIALLGAAAGLLTAVAALLHSWQTRSIADTTAARVSAALRPSRSTGPPTDPTTGQTDIAK
jgi:hypothetical protein